MGEMIQLGEIAVAVTRKNSKHVHLSVHPPTGRVTLAAPMRTRPEVARAYAISKLGWIRQHSRKNWRNNHERHLANLSIARAISSGEGGIS